MDKINYLHIKRKFVLQGVYRWLLRSDAIFLHGDIYQGGPKFNYYGGPNQGPLYQWLQATYLICRVSFERGRCIGPLGSWYDSPPAPKKVISIKSLPPPPSPLGDGL